MSIRNIYTFGFVLFLMCSLVPTIRAQEGFVRVILRIQSFQGTEGMPQNYLPYSGFVDPNLSYYMHPIQIKDIAGNIIGATTYHPRYLKNYNQQASEIEHVENDHLIDNTVYSNSFTSSFDLSNYSSLSTNFERLGANSTQGSYSFYTLPYSLPFSYMAPLGNHFQERTISISGEVAGYGTIPYPYHFKFKASCDVDGIQSNLVISSDNPDYQSTFCKGQTIRITANYKDNFHNGTFEFQKKYANSSNWITIPSGTGQNSVTDVAVQSGVTYRARLKASSSTYGVSNYNQWWGVASSNQYVTVNEVPNDINYFVRDVCEGDFLGSVRVTSLPGAVVGRKYKIELKNGNAVFPPHIIDSYTSDYFSLNTVSFPAPSGDYWLAVTEVTNNTLPCLLETPVFTLKENITSVFNSFVTHPICYAGNGNIQLINTQGAYKQFIYRAYSITTGQTITKTNYNYKADLAVPAGEYSLSVEDDNGCVYDLPGTVVLTDPPELIATITPDELIEVNGMDYHGCQGNLTTIELEITGGSPPYKVYKLINTNGRSYNLLPNQTSIRFPDLQSLTYEFRISDSKGCSVTPIFYTMRQIPPPTFPTLDTQIPTLACGTVVPDGSITQLEEVTGGIPPYDLFFNETQVSSFDSMNLPNVNAKLTIIDSMGCVYGQNVAVINSTFLLLSDNGEVPDTPVPCGGTHQIYLIIEGGSVTPTNPYVLFHNGVSCADDPNCIVDWFEAGYPIGYYTVTIDTGGVHYFEAMDNTGCVVSSFADIPVREIPKIESMSVVPPNCMNGIYEVTFYLNALNSAQYSSPTINYVLDGVAGNISPNLQGGVPIIPYEFTIPVSGDSLHQISVTDGINCGNPIPFEFTLTPLDPLTMTVDFLRNSTCSYDTSGVIGFSMTGDIPFQVELFKDGNRIDSLEVTSASFSFDDLPAGNYQIDIADAKGCSASENNIILTIPDTLQGTVSSTSTIDCTGSNGIIQVSDISGGTLPYTFALNDKAPQTDSLLLNAGLENEIIIRDSNNCIVTSSLSIPEAGPTLLPVFTIEKAVSDCTLGNAEMTLPPGFTYPLYITEVADPSNYSWIDTLLVADSLATIAYIETFTDLTLGKHYYYIKDGLGCETIDSMEMTLATPLSAAVLNKTDEYCYQQSRDGQITVYVQGGLAPYTITLLGDTTLVTNDSISFTGLYHGIYSFVVRDDNGCFFNLTDTIFAGSLPLLTSTIGNFTGCAGIDLLGEITLTGSNGTAPYTYEWPDGNMDNPRSGLPPGAYAVTVTDQNGCFYENVTILSSPDSLQLNTQSTTDVTCQADSTGQISVTTTGNFEPYSFSIDNGNTFQTDSLFTGLPIGNHTILVKDDHNCKDTTSATITYTNALTASLSTINESCILANDGTLEVTILDGIAPFTFSLDNINFQFQNTFSGLSAGTYIVWVQDGSGCKAVYVNNIITEPTLLTLSTSIVTSETCSASNGSISGTATGGTAPYSYEWNGNPALNNNTLTNVAAGTYTLMVTDANLCTESSTIVLSNSLSPELALQSSQSEICGMSNGQIDLAITNGTAPFIFNWSHNGTLNDSLATGLSAGTYNVTITDANMCSAILTTSLTEIAGPTLNLQSNANPVCTNDNGSISVALANGTAPFTYSWSHNAGLNNNTATSLPAGNYEVTITDGNECSDILTSSISFEAPPVFGTSTLVSATCGESNGSIQTSLTGGVTPLTYNWSHDPMLNTSTATLLPDGNYSVTVMDALGCTSVESNLAVTAETPPLLNISITNNSNCLTPMGMISVQTIGGLAPFVYSWSHDGLLSGPNATGLGAGIYTITVTDSNGCTTTEVANLVDGQGANLSLESSQSEICGMSNGEIDLAISSGTAPFTFNWSHDNTLNDSLATGLPAGNYSITVTDVNMCSAVLTTSITEIAGPTLSLQLNTNPVCTNDNGSISVALANGTAPFTYHWSHDNTLNNNVATGLSAGDYEVIVGDANGCTSGLNANIFFDAPPDVGLVAIVNATCDEPNGSIQLTTFGGTAPLTYQWSHDPTLTGDAALLLVGENYSVTVTDALGCSTVENNMTIANLTPPILSVASFNNTDCLNAMGDITVQTAGGLAPFAYAWSHDPLLNGTTATGLSSGNYSITVTDANGCESIVIQNLIEFEGALVITNELECSYSSDGSLLLNLQGNPIDYNYEWSDANIGNTHIATNLSMAMYTVTATNANGCTQDFEVNLTAPEELSLTISEVIPVGCNGNLGSIVAQANGGTGMYTYLWNDPINQNTAAANNLTAGVYELLLSDANGCTITGTAEVAQATEMELTPGVLSTLNCFDDENGSVEVVVTQGETPYTYLWNNNETTSVLTDLPSGNYTVTVTDVVGCTEVLTIPLLVPDLLTAEVITVEVPLCNGDNNGSVILNTIGGVMPYQYTWDDDQSQTTQNATGLISGTYTVLITDANGCTFTDAFTLADPEAIVLVNETVSPVSCLGTPNGAIAISAEGGTQGLNYNWSNGATGTNLEDLPTGIYQVSLVDGLGCESVESFLVGSIDVDPIDLGSADTTLCNNDVIFYDFSNSNYIEFEWGNISGGALSDESSFSTMGEESYFLYALRDDGCEVRDTIEVNFSAATLDAFFIAPTDIVAGDTLVALEVTLPVPDSVFWDYDQDNVFLVDQINNQYLFHFPNTGEYDLTLTSYSENCNNNITKPIFVYADSTELPFFNSTVPTIVDLKLFPNPNSGSFSIDVTLSGVHDMVIDVYNDKTDLVDRAVFSGGDVYKGEYELTLPAGIYYALVQVAGVRRTVSFVVD